MNALGRTTVAGGTIDYKDLVRIELTGNREAELWIDTQEIQRQFQDRFFYFEVKNSSRLAINKEDFRFDKTLKGEFVRLVYSKDGLEALFQDENK